MFSAANRGGNTTDYKEAALVLRRRAAFTRDSKVFIRHYASKMRNTISHTSPGRTMNLLKHEKRDNGI